MKYQVKNFFLLFLYVLILNAITLLSFLNLVNADDSSKPAKEQSIQNAKQTHDKTDTQEKKSTTQKSENFEKRAINNSSQNDANHPKGKLLATYSDTYGNLAEVRIKDISESISMLKNKNIEKIPELTKEFLNLENNLQKNIILDYVLQINLLEEAGKSNVKESKEFKSWLEKAANGILLNIYLEKKIENAPDFDLMVDLAYENYTKSLSQSSEFKFQTVKFSDQKSAESLYQKLSKKQDNFLKIVKGSKSVTNFELEKGYIEESKIEEIILDKIKNMSFNSVSKPFQNTEEEWIIVKLLDKRAISVKSKEKMMPYLQSEVRKNIFDQIRNTLIQKSKIEIII